MEQGDNFDESLEEFFYGNKYDVSVDYSFDTQEPNVTVHPKEGYNLDRTFDRRPPGLCWNFSDNLERHLQDHAAIDLLAQDILDYLDDEVIRGFEEDEDDPYSIPWNYWQRKYCFLRD